jgi:hypothetical protein
MTHQTTAFSIVPILALALASLAGCAGIQPGERQLVVSGMPYELPEPGTVLGSVEEAAVAALVHARTNAKFGERKTLMMGSVIQVEGGYTWLEPLHSESYARATRSPVVRLVPSDRHVATYVVHPRTGQARLDRLNEEFQPSEKEAVDHKDPLHRPMFLLTPRDRIIAYAHGESTVELADLRRGWSSGGSKAETGIAAVTEENGRFAAIAAAGR